MAVLISCVFFDGVVSPAEPDEYVEIRNGGAVTAEMGGWRLRDIADGFPEFIFPAFTLEPALVIRVYTNEVHPEYGGFSFGRGSSIWNNSDPDEAGLFDAAGNLLSTATYPPGC